MRFYILRALLAKELNRHLLNRGGLALAALLVVSAVMLSYFNPGAGAGGTGGGPLVGGVHHCYVEFAEDTPFIDALDARLPADLRPHVVFRLRRPADVDGTITYEPGAAAIQIRTTETGYLFWVWHPPGAAGAVAVYEKWFWPAARDALAEVSGVPVPPAPPGDDLWAVKESFARLRADSPAVPTVQIDRSGLGAKELDLRSAVATGMVVFALYFACVYLLPTLNCEERERGVLLAQALSPASPAEILTAKFLFYPVFGMALAGLIAGIYQPAAATSLFFWLAVGTVAAGFLGIGMTVATLARTQKAAFMGGMCYLLSVSLVLIVCTQNNIMLIPWLAIEFHGPRILHAAVTREVRPEHWKHLVAAAVLASGWIAAAGWLFRRRGWQ
jgi:hypothetical protein